jgi:uncharacterized protein
MNSNNQINNYPPVHHIVFVVLFTIFFVLAISIVGYLVGGKTGLFLLEGLIIVPALVYVVLRKYDLKNIFRLKKVNFQIVLISIIIGFGISFIADGLDRLFQLFFSMPEIFEKQMLESFVIHSISDFAIIVLSAVVFAGVFEEMLFRGFVQKTFEKEFSVSQAILITAFIFGMIHMNPWWLVQISFFGVFLGIMAWKSDSIIPSMIVHFINNGLSIIFINLVQENDLFFNRSEVYIAVLIVALFITFFGLNLFFKICDRSKHKQS